jgi:hypothetical protein
MQAQTAPHHWLLLLDSATPDSFRRVVEECREFQPVYIDSPHTLESVQHAVWEHVALDTPTHLITTRLDSDDAIASHHLATIQRHARPKDHAEFLNLPLGYQWRDERLYLSCDLSNPFLSYVEPVGEQAPLTVFRMAHMWARRAAPVRQVWARPQWIQVLHADNDASALDGIRRLHASTPRGFRGQPAFEHVDATGRMADLRWTVPWYLNRRRGLVRDAVLATLTPGRIESDPDRGQPA